MAADDEKEDGSGEKGARPSWVDDDPFTNRVVIKPPRSDGALAQPTKADKPARPVAPEPEQPKSDTPRTEPANEPPQNGTATASARQPPRSGTATAKPPGPAPKDPAPLSTPNIAVDPALLQENRQQAATEPRRGTAAGGPAPRSRRRVATEVLPRVGNANGKAPPPYSDDPASGPAGPRRPGRRLLRIPLWIWLLVLVATFVIVPLMVDLLNRDRFRLSCEKAQLEAKRHRRFPWPVGFERMAGPLRPVKLFSEATCVGSQDFRSREELEAAFLNQVISQVRRGVANPASRDLKVLRAQLNQARQLALLDAHLGRRKEVKQILADLNYREGRARLGRVEMNLREALALLREAQKLAGERYEDLADWISHIESLLRTLAPPPTGSGMTPGGIFPGLPMPKIKGGKTPPTPGRIPPTPPRPSKPALPRRPHDGGAATPSDAGAPPTGSGILM